MERSNLRKLITLRNTTIVVIASLLTTFAVMAGTAVPMQLPNLKINATNALTDEALGFSFATSAPKALVPPKITTTNRANFSSPFEGMYIFNTTTHWPQWYDGSAWQDAGCVACTQSPTNKTISITGNTISGGTASSIAKFDASGFLVSASSVGTSLGGTGQDFSASTGVLQVLSGVVSASSVSLTTGVSGITPVANGGTGIASGTSGGVPYYSGTSTIASSGALTNRQVVLGGGAGAAPRVASGTGTSGQVLTSTGASSDPTWQDNAGATGYNSIRAISNLGMTSSVAASSMAIAIKQKDGSSPAAGAGAVSINFRNSNASTGTFSAVSLTTDASVTITSGATLGLPSGKSVYIWTYALNDAGTIDVCVTGGNPINENTPQAATVMSAASDFETTLYCQNSHSGSLPVRLVGRCLVTETTAGAYTSNCTELDLQPIPTYATTAWSSAVTNTMSASTTTPTKGNSGVGTVDRMIQKREGRMMHIHSEYQQTNTTGAAAGSGAYLWVIPGGQVADTTFHTPSAVRDASCNLPAGVASTLPGNGSFTFASRGQMSPKLWDSTRFGFCAYNNTTFEDFSSGGDTAFTTAASGGWAFDVWVTISGWFDYGP